MWSCRMRGARCEMRDATTGHAMRCVCVSRVALVRMSAVPAASFEPRLIFRVTVGHCLDVELPFGGMNGALRFELIVYVCLCPRRGGYG
eukprot:scaffold4287_cov65-Phaeocystis_antarctica.AAC.3